MVAEMPDCDSHSSRLERNLMWPLDQWRRFELGNEESEQWEEWEEEGEEGEREQVEEEQEMVS